MSEKIEKRVLNEALYMIKTKQTLREIAKEFNVSKSTVHKDLREKLKNVDNNLYIKVLDILEEHLQVRHIRGGE